MPQLKELCYHLSFSIVNIYKILNTIVCTIYTPFVWLVAPCPWSVVLLGLGCSVVDKSWKRLWPLRGAKKPQAEVDMFTGRLCVCVVSVRVSVLAGDVLGNAIDSDISVFFFLPDPSHWPPQLRFRLVLWGNGFAIKEASVVVRDNEQFRTIIKI